MKTNANIKLVSVIILTLFALTALAQQAPIQYWRPYDQRGINVFENSKNDTVEFTGFKVRFGAGFTQGFQSFSHSNKAKAILPAGSGSTPNNPTYIETAPGSGNFINRATGAAVAESLVKDPNVYGGYINTTTKARYTDANQLYEMAAGLPLAQANFNIDVQITDGVRLNLVSYMSAHHHNEFWVKGGYFQIDKVGFLKSEFMNKMWKNLTLKIGHMEINYGDQHFRRSDGGSTLLNPFMENYIMDEFTTEIGGELYFQKAGFVAMLGLTDGEIQGNVSKPADRSPSIYGKLGYDRNFTEKFRGRLTGSIYTTKSSVRNTLYGGDRTGSNYQFVLDNTAASTTGNFTSGRFNPGLTDNLTAIMVNPFVKFGGLEFFGTYEIAKGNSSLENGEVKYSDDTKNATANRDGSAIRKLDNRTATQVAGDLIYRFGKNEKFYIGARYNKVTADVRFGQGTGQATNIDQIGDLREVTIDRTAIAAGWFITRNVMLKGEYVWQNYGGFPVAFKNYSSLSATQGSSATGYEDSSTLAGGKFNGFVIQGIISF